MNTTLMFSSKTDLWATPQSLFDELNSEFSFETDVCATPENAKCEQFITREQDALSEAMWPRWKGSLWMNPPYGREIGKWVKRAYEAALLHGATAVCLLPARTDTRWWHDYCMKASIRFLRGRVKFGDGNSPAPFSVSDCGVQGSARGGQACAMTLENLLNRA